MTELTEEQEREEERAVLKRLGDEIIRRQMTAPAIFMLESVRPLTFLASQALIVLEPVVKAILSLKDYDVFVRAIERRANVTWLMEYLERAPEAGQEGDQR